MSTFQGESSLFFETSSGVNSDRDAGAVVLAFCHGLHVLEVTKGPSKQLRWLEELVYGGYVDMAQG